VKIEVSFSEEETLKGGVKFTNGGLSFYFAFYFYFLICFILIFSILRTTKFRVDWSHCHISHNLIV